MKEGKLFQIASEKCATPSDNSSMASSTDASLGGSRGKGGTIGLGEGSVEGFIEGSMWTEQGSLRVSSRLP
jgi:hypothetical protein